MNLSSSSWEIALMVVLILLSAFFSGSETAMMAVNRMRLRHRVKKDRRARLLKDILKTPEKLIGTLLLCNNLVNVALSAIGTGVAIKLWGERGIAYATMAVTLILLIFSEITPKTIAAYYPNRISVAIAPIVALGIRFLYPVVHLLGIFSKGLICMLGMKTVARGDLMTEEEIRSVIEAGGDEGVLDHGKKEMLMGIMSLEETTVGDIMIPLRDVVALSVDADYDQVYHVIEKTQVSRYPVYEGNPSQLIGFIHVRDFLLAGPEETFSVRKILRDPTYVPELRSIRQQLINFQSERIHLSIIVDEYGNIKGIVTLEDILEEIVGEIRDEHDPTAHRVAQLPDGSYRIKGKMLIRDLNRWLRIDLPDKDVRTVAGFIVKKLDRIPVAGDTVSLGKYRLVAEELKGKSIVNVRLWIDPKVRS